MFRMDALVLGISLQICRNPQDRANLPSLHFTAVCCWLIASINARPQDWAAHIAISNATLLGIFNIELGALVRVHTGGAYWFHRLVMQDGAPVSRIQPDPNLDTAVARFYGHPTLAEVFRYLQGLQRSLNVAPAAGFDRQPNRAGPSAAVGVVPEDLDALPFFEFHDLPAELREETEDFWVTHLTQYLNKAPNERSRGTWMTTWFYSAPHHFAHMLEPRVEDRQPVHPYLSKFWRKYMSKTVPDGDWTKAFNFLFPTDPEYVIPPKSTGWLTLLKLGHWLPWMRGRTDAERQLIKVALRRRFDTLRWIGEVGKWKMWKSSASLETGFTGDNGGVLLWLNPNPQPVPLG